MREVHVSAHALRRYRERVADLPEAEIVCALNTPTIRQAIDLGCAAVKLGTGQHVVIRDRTIITVLPKGSWKPNERESF